MDPAQDDATPGGTSLQTAIKRRLLDLNARSYKRNTENILSNVFAEYLDTYRDVQTVEEIEVLDCRRYAQWLRKCATHDPEDLEDEPLVVDISPRSASAAGGPYFSAVRAFLGWCVADELLDSNPAKPARVTKPLPEPTGAPNQQFWSAREREAILSFVDERAHTALNDDTIDHEQAFRDRAMVYLLALSGVRGAEVFRTADETGRRGLTWDRVDLEGGTFDVYGKSREWESAQLQPEAIDRLRRYKQVQDPPEATWPLFPTRHRPTLAGLDEGEAPPSITTRGARSVMQDLCGAADIDIDGEYLKLHGARRGLGSDLYEVDAELAQEVLRHQSVETTQESYRDVDMAQRRDDVGEALGRNGLAGSDVESERG